MTAATGSPWDAWKPAVCMPADCFCELPRSAWIRQPANTWSNLVTAGVGVVLLALAFSKRKNPRSGRLGEDPRPTSIVGALVVLLGAGSFFYHASLTYAGQWVDVLGMYLVVGYLALYALSRAGLLRGKLGWWLLGLAAASGAFLSFGLAYGRPLFAAELVVLLAAEARARRAGVRRPLRRFLAALGLFVVAFGLWCLDRFRVVCAPRSLWQGHAAWHALTAGALGALYLYYAGEAPAVTAAARAAPTASGART